MSENFYKLIIGIVKAGSKPLSRTRIKGLENVPETGGIIVAPNHISNIDPVLLGVAFAPKRQLKALAKESLFSVPVVKTVLTKMGHIPVKRNSTSAAGSLEKAVEHVKKGEAVAIYPEGTIPINLETLGAFKSGAARLALITGAPLIPVAQWGAQHSLPRNATLKNIRQALRKRPLNTIVVGKPLQHKLLNGQPRDKVDPADATQVTIALAEKIEELVEPMRNKERTRKQHKEKILDDRLKELTLKQVF